MTALWFRRLSFYSSMTLGAAACGGSFVAAVADGGGSDSSVGVDTGTGAHDAAHGGSDAGGNHDSTVPDEASGSNDSGPPGVDSRGTGDVITGDSPDDDAPVDGGDGDATDGAEDGATDAAEDGDASDDDAAGTCTSGGTTCDTAGTCPTPSNPCEVAACNESCCGTSDKAPGAACNAGGRVCDSSGHCVACIVAGDCPTPASQCQVATCSSAHTCGTANVMSGMTCNQDNGNVCDSDGQCVACNSPTDCAPTGTACIVNTCSTSHACGTMNAMPETTCTDSTGKVCDGDGHCVACVGNGDCLLPGQTCTNNMCSGV